MGATLVLVLTITNNRLQRQSKAWNQDYILKDLIYRHEGID